MSYLSRLKQLDTEKKSLHIPDNEPTKPTEGAFDGFVGSNPGIYEKNLIIAGDSTAINDTRHFRWLVYYPDMEPSEETFLPELTHAEVMAWKTTAVSAEPLPECAMQAETPEHELVDW